MSLSTQSEKDLANWVDQFYHVLDSHSTADFHKFFTKESKVQFGNSEPCVGLDDLMKFFDSISPALESTKHNIISIDTIHSKNRIILTCMVTYVVKGDATKEAICAPAAAIFDLKSEWQRGQRMEDQAVIERGQVYMDAGPVLVRVGEVAKGSV